MNSFYGGPNGQSFVIKGEARFTSRYGENVQSIENDLSKGWTSPVGVGEFAIVSYGNPGDDSYEIYRNRDIDLDPEHNGYNATLWVKTYDESAGNANGLNYELITYLTSYIPRTGVTIGDILDPGEKPAVEINKDATSGYPDTVQFVFDLPGSWDFVTGDQKLNPLNPGEPPVAKLINVGTLGDNADRDLEQEKAYMGKFEFSLPQSQDFQETGKVIKGEAGSDPKLALDKTDPVHPILELTLPVTQQFLTDAEHITYNPIHPKDLPSVEMGYAEDDTLHEHPILTFNLPKAWDLDIDSVIEKIDDPMGTPVIADVTPSGSEIKVWQLSLPRNAQFHVVETENEMTIPGDYYILKNTGVLFGHINGQWRNLVSLRPLVDEVVGLKALAPYTDEGASVQPVVSVDYQEAKGAWQFNFELPKAPKADAKVTEVLDPTRRDETAASIEISNADNESTLVFNFKVPAGARWFTGEKDVLGQNIIEITGALNGDYYLHSETGSVYKAEDGVWVSSDTDLTGPQGDSLHVITSYELSEEDYPDSDAIENYIENECLKVGITIKSDMLFAVTTTKVENDQTVGTAYWYFQSADGVWGHVQLTGGTAGLIVTEYQKKEVTDKAYSISYINTLIEGLEDGSEDSKFKATYSQERIKALIKELENVTKKYEEALNTYDEFGVLWDGLDKTLPKIERDKDRLFPKAGEE